MGFYSGIKQKYGQCVDCIKDGDENKKPLIAGRCKYKHYPLYRVKVRRQRAIDRVKKMLSHKEEESISLLDWFKDKMLNSPRVCQNCGTSLRYYNEKSWHGSQHHILEKSIFKSVKTHPENHLVLGKWCCHHLLNDVPSNITKMPIFEEARRKALIVMKDMSQSDLRRFPEYFLPPIQ